MNYAEIPVLAQELQDVVQGLSVGEKRQVAGILNPGVADDDTPAETALERCRDISQRRVEETEGAAFGKRPEIVGRYL